MIEFDDVHFTYSGAKAEALSGVDLEIARGEYVVVAGRSGTGKSTLLRCMNGLVPHFHGGVFGGRITVDGVDTIESSVRDLSQTVGLVFQDPENQFVTTSVRNEMAFGQENLGWEEDIILERIGELSRFFDLVPLLDRAPDAISGGEKQKSIIASILAMGTKVLALDEPTSQLDPRSAEQIFSILGDLNGNGITIVLTEHRLKRALRDASRTIVLDEGEVIADGGPDLIPSRFKELLHFPRDIARDERPEREVKIEVRDLSFRYSAGDPWVLQGLSLTVLDSELLAVMGSNGSGKSTLARILTGLLDSYQGEMEIRSGVRVGVVFQNPNKQLFHDTVAEEVAFSGRRLGRVETDSPERLLDRMRLHDVADKNPRDLSGGQKEKVAIASVLSYRPDVLILDEPTRGLDLPEKVRIMRYLRDIMEEDSMSIIVLSHDLDLVQAFADRAAILSGGRISESGSVNEVVPHFRRMMNDG